MAVVDKLELSLQDIEHLLATDGSDKLDLSLQARIFWMVIFLQEPLLIILYFE